MSYLITLCDDVLHLIFTFLTLKELEKVQLVSKYLSHLAMHDDFYRTFYKRKLISILSYARNVKLMTKHDIDEDNLLLFYDDFLHRNHNFRNNLLELYSKIEDKIKENLKLRRKLYQENSENSISFGKYRNCQEIKNWTSIKEIQTNLGELMEENKSIPVLVWAERKIGATRFIHRCWSSTFPSYLILQQLFEFDIYDENNNSLSKLVVSDCLGCPRVEKRKTILCLMYSVSSPISFENIRNKWINEFNQRFSNNDPIVLIACKTDLRNDEETRWILRYRYFQTPIERWEGESMAKSTGCSTYLEASALEAKGNIKDFSEILFKLYFQHYYEDKFSRKSSYCILT